MKPIKVLHLVNVDKENYYLNNLCDYSDSEELEYLFVTFAGHTEFAEALEKRGRKVYALDAIGRKSYPRGAYKIWNILKEEDPDIVHTHLFDPTVIGLTLAKWQDRKTVYTRHHSDAIHELTSILKRTFYLKLEGYINRRADRIIAPSQMVRDVLVDWENVPAEKVSIIPYGQTAERFEAITQKKIEETRASLNIKEDELTLVCNSRLYPGKGHIYLFEALADLIKSNGLKTKLFLVGTGDYRPQLEELTRQIQIENEVIFLGWRDDALEIMANADIIVHPSLEDALSSAVIESIMLELPIIATDISGVRDSLDGGKYGKIVPPADADSFTKAIQETLENMDSAREKAKAGKKYLLKYMDAGHVADQYQEIYKSLLYL